jgi:surface carbohydrate biosynthesis protein
LGTATFARWELSGLAIEPILYLPIEVASRELDSRLLLALCAIRRGFEVILGQKWLLERNIEAMPPGVYFSKTLTKRDGRTLARARKAGYFVAAIDEELPGILATETDMRWMSPDSVASCDLIFVAGAGNTRAFAGRFGAGDRVVTIGNPRWDLLKPPLRRVYRAEVERIQQAYGRFILLNTNLGLTNTEKGDPDQIIQDLIRLGKLDRNNPGDMAYYGDIRIMETANQAVMVELLQRLPAAFPGLNIVLRPHPSERLAPWQAAAAGIDRVHVVRSGPAVPWIMACEALVHTNCTTGAEAHALDKPAICVLPTDLPVNDRYLSNRVNPTVRDAQQALDLLREILAGTGQPPYDSQMRDLYANAMSYDPHSLDSEAIVNRLYEAAGHLGEGRREGWKPGWRCRWQVPQKNVRGVLMPELKAETVHRRMGEIAGLLNVSHQAKVEQCGAKLVWITERKVPIAFYGWRTMARLWSALTPKAAVAS